MTDYKPVSVPMDT
jgi:hypothetical protein